MERETGVEPATSTLARSRSTTELLPLDVSFYCTCAFTDNSRHTYWYALMVWVPFHIGPASTGKANTPPAKLRRVSLRLHRSSLEIN
jgi:hypothetical protein